MHRFRMIAEGTHYHHNRRPINKGDTIDSERDLVQIFPGKFEDLGEVSAPQLPPVSTKKVAPITEDSSPEEGAGKGKPAAAKVEGEDVTSQFPKVANSGLRVFKVGLNAFNVVDMELGKPINPKPIAKSKVNEFA